MAALEELEKKVGGLQNDLTLPVQVREALQYMKTILNDDLAG
jgi:hypothetical protein